MGPWLSDRFLSSQSDERLVSLARAGHDRAFVAIVERYRGPLQAFARRLSADGPAEDVVQQSFLSAFKALRAGAEVTHLRGWLHQIVRHAAVNAASRTPLESELREIVDGRSGTEEQVERRMLVLDGLSEIARLPERQREALLGTVEGRSRSEVAAAMGVSEGAVRQLVHRARARVRAAATAIVPYPMAEWTAASRPGAGAERMVEVIAGALSASAGGLVLKAGAVVVSGVVAAGILAPDHRRVPVRSGSHASIAASPPRASLLADKSPDDHGAGGGAVALRVVLRGGRRAGASRGLGAANGAGSSASGRSGHSSSSPRSWPTDRGGGGDHGAPSPGGTAPQSGPGSSGSGGGSKPGDSSDSGSISAGSGPGSGDGSNTLGSSSSDGRPTSPGSSESGGGTGTSRGTSGAGRRSGRGGGSGTDSGSSGSSGSSDVLAAAGGPAGTSPASGTGSGDGSGGSGVNGGSGIGRGQSGGHHGAGSGSSN